MVMVVKRKFLPDFVHVVMGNDDEPLYVVTGDDEAEAIRNDKAVEVGGVYKVPAVALLGCWQTIDDEEVANG